ncbi:hypothetical protein [Motiliproteus sp. SC1-56]|uniref:hypothetical protein n=1 Tax=Motiliproteus sp. SC1-56 TaxID=2799565 RepID=UPI001A8D3F9D|nr:hypothetical protein [Motiliproteus sp. SC1-56]
MTEEQLRERVCFELRHLEWKAFQLEYSLDEVEDQLMRLHQRVIPSISQDFPSWLDPMLADFRESMRQR